MKLYTVILIVLLSIHILAQDQNSTLAKIGSASVKKSEFIKRFELSPHPRPDRNFDSVEIKKDFLKTLIAEKLLAQQATKLGLDKTKEYKDSYNYMLDFYLRDMLFKIEVKDKAVLPDSDLAVGRNRLKKTIHTKFIFSADEKEIFDISDAIKKGASFDSILTTRSEKDEQKNSAEVTFGTLNKKMEDVVFSLKPGEVTAPIELKEGWYICKVYSGSIKNTLDEKEENKVKNIVRARREEIAYYDFYKRFFKGVVVNADKNLFNILFEAIDVFLKGNKNTLIRYQGKFTIYETEISKISSLINEKELSKIFVKFEKDPITLGGFLDYMKLAGFDFLRAESGYIKNRLNSYISNFIQNKIIAREALKRGYDKLPDVAEDMKIWRDNYLSNLAMKQNFKTQNVSDEEAYDFYSKNSGKIPKPDEVKFSKIVSADLDVIQKILDGVDKGSEFSELKKVYSKNEESGDEEKYYPLNQEGDLWKALRTMKVGEVYGPLKLNEGFAVIKLIDKREGKKELIESFEEAKPQLKNILQTRKMYKELEDVTAKLAVDNNININEKALNSIKVNMTNIIVYRRFGFGGQQLAVPYAPNFSAWYQKYQQLKKSLSL